MNNKLSLMERFLKRLPKKYHARVDVLEADEGLIDNCRYMLYLKEDWQFCDGGQSYPVRSIDEAVYFVRETYPIAIKAVIDLGDELEG